MAATNGPTGATATPGVLALATASGSGSGTAITSGTMLPVTATALSLSGGVPDNSGNQLFFVCQHCRLPLRLDSTLTELSVETVQSVAASARAALATANAGETQAGPQAHPSLAGSSVVTTGDVPIRRVAFRPSEDTSADTDPSDTFVIVQPYPEATRARPPRSVRVAARLFDVLSSKSLVDHPLCEECNGQLQNDLKIALREAELERDSYRRSLESPLMQPVAAEELAEIEREIERLEREENELLDSLKSIALEFDELERAGEELDRQAANIQAQEHQYWRDLNEFQQDQETFQNERDALVRKHTYATEQLKRLRNTTVYEEVFRIWHDGPFGTINNLRLGRQPNYNVDWSEINAAWGQALLLLQILGKKLRYEFRTYKLIPMGSFSRFEKIGEPKVALELFGSGEYRQFFRNNQKFDTAMIAFLDCLNQLIIHAKEIDRDFSVPFEIVGERIAELSIKYNPDANWTRALKLTLIDLKWVMAWVSAHST